MRNQTNLINSAIATMFLGILLFGGLEVISAGGRSAATKSPMKFNLSNGRWSYATIRSDGIPTRTGGVVKITKNSRVVYDVFSEGEIAELTIEGPLIFSRNVGYNAVGHGILLENGDEVFVNMDHILGVLVRSKGSTISRVTIEGHESSGGVVASDVSFGQDHADRLTALIVDSVMTSSRPIVFGNPWHKDSQLEVRNFQGALGDDFVLVRMDVSQPIDCSGSMIDLSFMARKCSLLAVSSSYPILEDRNV